MFENTNDFTQRRVEANYRHSFCHKVIYFFIFECLVLLFDFLQSDWLQDSCNLIGRINLRQQLKQIIETNNYK
jgi:hypothetical protein